MKTKKIYLQLTGAFLACVLQASYAQEACPTGLNLCGGKGVTHCTPELTSQRVRQTQIFSCDPRQAVRAQQYGCLVYGENKAPLFSQKCEGTPGGLTVQITMGFTKPHFNYFSTTPQKFRVAYCCKDQD